MGCVVITQIFYADVKLGCFPGMVFGTISGLNRSEKAFKAGNLYRL